MCDIRGSETYGGRTGGNRGTKGKNSQRRKGYGVREAKAYKEKKVQEKRIEGKREIEEGNAW
jgi:hypothetical protein